MPVVDENNYVLKTFDFVLDPGFLIAVPKFDKTMEMLAECYSDNVKELDMTNAQRESKIKIINRDLDLILRRS